jgi:hypothetical protein
MSVNERVRKKGRLTRAGKRKAISGLQAETPMFTAQCLGTKHLQFFAGSYLSWETLIV